jgi:hypothetical protein
MTMDSPGISLTFPSEASISEPIPLEAFMRSDARTYWDNDGILDKALTVALVRRDQPGLRFLDKIDRGALMMPDEPLPGRPSDAQLDADTGMVSERKLLDAGGVSIAQQGSAEYFVTAAFSKWWVGPKTLRVNDPRGRVLPSDQTPQLGPGMRPWPIRSPQHHADPSVRVERATMNNILVVPLRIARPIRTFPDDSGKPHAWLSVLGFKLATSGGACGGMFDLGLADRSQEIVGEFSMPISALTPRPDAGCWIFSGFVGEEALSPNKIWLTDDDVR